MNGAAGPLRGLKVLEFAGIGPGPFCAMLRYEIVADFLQIDRAGFEVPDVDLRRAAGDPWCWISSRRAASLRSWN